MHRGTESWCPLRPACHLIDSKWPNLCVDFKMGRRLNCKGLGRFECISHPRLTTRQDISTYCVYYKYISIIPMRATGRQTHRHHRYGLQLNTRHDPSPTPARRAYMCKVGTTTAQ